MIFIFMCDYQWDAKPEGCDFELPAIDIHICQLSEKEHSTYHECYCGVQRDIEDDIQSAGNGIADVAETVDSEDFSRQDNGNHSR